MHTACIQTLSLKTSRQDFWNFVMSEKRGSDPLFWLAQGGDVKLHWDGFWFLKPQIYLLMEINTSDKTQKKLKHGALNF